LLDGSIFSLTLDNSGWASLARARSRWRASGRLRTLDLRATRTRARRALT